MAEKTFEQSLADLEKVVSQLEKGETSLEESIALYEKGVELTRFCTQQLEKAELKIVELKAGKSDETVS